MIKNLFSKALQTLGRTISKVFVDENTYRKFFKRMAGESMEMNGQEISSRT